MTPGQWRQPLHKTPICGIYVVQWVPTPNHPLPVRRPFCLELLETLSNNSPMLPFHFKMFSATGRLVVILSADAFVVLECCLHVVNEDIL